MRVLLILVLFLQCGYSSAQITVEGKCKDQSRKPLSGVEIAIRHAAIYSTVTDSTGHFSLLLPQVDSATIYFKIEGAIDTMFFYDFKGKDHYDIGTLRFNFKLETDVEIIRIKEDDHGIVEIPPIVLDRMPFRSAENILIYTAAGARSSNELTANYNVQGGSYDENLVYVNGFLINRPFLTRSGQQEGMSFIHTGLVKSISFAAGGFNAEYGDKLSSVLDIEYKKPATAGKGKTNVHGSLNASLLSVESHIEQSVGSRFAYVAGARYRSNGYFLNSLPTKGAYNPVFYDAQLLTSFSLTDRWTWSVIGHFSTNDYRFQPQTQRTDFGTANEAYSFTIYFEGGEQTRFQTMTAGTALEWATDPFKKKQTHLGWYTTVFNTDEREYFDVLGQYFINELETDPSKEEFGDSIAVLGVGSFLNHARNRLQATILNIYHTGDHELYKGFNKDTVRFQEHLLKWGVNFQMDHFNDVLSEWRMIDSAGYSIPQAPDDQITLFETIKGQATLDAQRYTSFVQLNSTWKHFKRDYPVTITKTYKENKERKSITFRDTIASSMRKWTMSLGVRAGYTTANKEPYVTPRVTVKYFPRSYLVKDSIIQRRNLSYRFSAGLYYQPPFYREFRTFAGDLNLDVKAQKSFHAVLGSDFYFHMWNRDVPFKLTSEAFYKYLWDVNPYEVDNVRTRYYAENIAKAYAYGVDFILNGEFVEGIQSFFKIGLLQTREDLLNDYYFEYYNAAGETIIFGISEDQTVVDSSRIEPGFIPRPTDQLFTVTALVQDRMPSFESFSVQMGLNYGSSLPYGPPDNQRYKDTLRIKPYFRVDIGFSYDFLYKKSDKRNFIRNNFSDALLSFEVFNLLGVNNVLSKQWVMDTQGKYYSIPNYLTARRFNLKLILKF